MNKQTYITVFGATGKIGSELLRLLSGAQIPTVAITRDRSKAVQLPFVEWLEADMNQKDSLALTMINSKSVFLASAAGEQIVEEQCNVIDAAVEVGVQHIVKVSSVMANPNSALFIAQAHGQIEDYLKASGMNATLLRPTGFMQNWLLGLVHTVKTQRKIFEATGDGKRAYIDLRDIAEVAFHILQEPEKHVCHAYILTGGEAINYDRLAATITGALGEQVTYVPIIPEIARQQLEQKGVPAWNIATFLAYYEEQRNHQTDFVSGDVADILQKAPRTASAFIQEYAALFN